MQKIEIFLVAKHLIYLPIINLELFQSVKRIGKQKNNYLEFIEKHSFLNCIGEIFITELLEILRITKQSLSRVLSQLVDNEYVITEQCKVDRRRRLLKITDKGSELEDKLSKIHKEILSRAFRGAGAEAVAGYRNVLLGIIDEKDHKRFKKR